MSDQNAYATPHRKLTTFVSVAFLGCLLLVGGVAFDSYRFL